ncbi:nucleoprotein TPR-like isoform X1 [Dendroctonus ponderosae]|uniref:Nucleoprotein TPR n=1 Tax=Dendroctonus ponderosae TaxID=77166 RepID=A0AAR5P591_DENPD|nr:nucleoprotein TPR isoform X1 [Dendroctonus ponderosae]XP_048520315.1 nucleoprotein TPR-like isoform X1 [Dendroctonus ponderosae]
MESFPFEPVVSLEEWEMVPKEIGKKISKFVNEKFDEFITTKALLETKSTNSDKSSTELKEQNDVISSENEALKARLEAAGSSITELENQVSTLSAELIRLQTQANQLESEAAQYRHERNLAVDDRDEQLKMLQRRTGEAEMLQLDIETLTKQLEDAINTKCEALAKAEEVESMKLTLEYKEKRLEQERSLMNSQIQSLTEELEERTDELLNMRRDNSSRCIQLEAKLAERTQELGVFTEQVKSLTEMNQTLTTRNEELAQKIFNLNETHAKVNESYVCEIEGKTKMANTYKSMHEESQKHTEELRSGLSEVQELLRKATEQYGELETKSKETDLAHEEIIGKKNDYIAMLKKELETANEVIELNKNESLSRDIEGISTSAASVSRMMKSGMTYTEVYSRYVSVNEQLTSKEEECTRLNNYITCIVKEIEEKGPLIKQLRQEYSDTLDANEVLKQSNDSLLAELQQLREAQTSNRRIEGQAVRENQRMKKEIADLSRQVIHLLQEVEHSRIGSSSTSTDNDLSDSVNSADIITKRLVTFNDIAELQSTNQKLLALVRELSEHQQEAESFDPAAIANLQRKLEELRESQSELLDERDQQTKMMSTLRNQRDMYKNLYSQVMKGAGDMATPLERSLSGQDNADHSKAQSDSDSSPNDEEKLHEFEIQINKYKKQAEQMKEEFETYRKDRSDHEKILVEQLESFRNESKELMKLNFQLAAQSELAEEKFKTLQNNAEIYKKQITALEKQNKIYSEAIVKHEQAASYLKDEAIQNQTRASKAEVMLANIQKENALLRDAERRLLKECDMQKQHAHQQNLLHSNIELIKVTLERNDAESKLRLQAKLDEAHLECSTLRRRLDEELNRFRELSSHLEKQAKQAVERMEEEKMEADKLRKEIAETREELINKTMHIEDLSMKLKSSVFAIPDSSVEGRKLRDLEQQFSDAQAEINSLRTLLKSTKAASEEYFNIAQNAEKQLKDVVNQEQQYKDEIEKQTQLIKELQEKCGELQGELSLQLDDQDMANSNIKTKSQLLEKELNVKSLDLRSAQQTLENAQADIKNLNDQIKAVENKYAREVTLHSADLQALTELKSELDASRNLIKSIESERDQAVEALSQNLASAQQQQKILNEEKEKLEERFKNMDDQNSLLLDQIQQLNTQLTILQSRASADNVMNQSIQNTSLPSSETSFNRSLAEDDVHNSEQLLKIIKYLRHEKDIAVSKADIIEAEHFRLKSQFESVSQQLEGLKAQIESERQQVEVTNISAAKHAEVLRKLETLNAITDSNRALRQERDNLLEDMGALRVRADILEAEVAPLQEKNRDLMTKSDQMQNENISLRGECTRWRQRANQLIEKTNRTSPEDWKKLQTERETLAKQLTVERGNTAKLNDENNNLKQNVGRLEEQLRVLRVQNNNQADEMTRLREQVAGLQSQVSQITESLEQQNQANKNLIEENRQLTEGIATRDVSVSELRNNLTQVKKIAKKYKTQYEDQVKDIESLKQQNEQSLTEQSINSDKQTQLLEQQKSEHEERVNQLETSHKESVDQLSQQVTSSQDQIDSLRKEIDSLKQTSQEKEEKFKTLFKNAKDRIVSLTEQNSSLKEQLSKEKSGSAGDQSNANNSNSELLERINNLQQEKVELIEKLQQDKIAHTTEIDSMKQTISQLERKLGQQQGSKPSTSSASSDKSPAERPTADIKPIPGHSTNTQTQSVPIQPWRNVGEPPLASIRPMSQQLRTAAVLPTTQTPSAVMVPPQQQVHTTGSSSIEALSSSPTSSHTDYVPATSSASSAIVGPRQVAVPPTQSSEDDDNAMQIQPAPQQQTLAVVSPRVEPPSSGGATQEQGTSSSSSNTVTTTQAGLKRQREPDTDSCQAEEKSQTKQQIKRTRLQQAGTVSDSGLDVEYQVPTSSQRDQDDDNVIVVESDDETAPDEGEGDDQEEPDDTEAYDMEGMEQDTYEDADCQDVEDEEEGGNEVGNEVEVIEDSSEVPNQSESQEVAEGDASDQQAQSEAISSGTDAAAGPSSSFSRASTSSTPGTTFSRSRLVPPLPHRHHMGAPLAGLLDEGGLDDGIVPSTPTLFAPRRSDGFGEAVSSPHVPSSAIGRFTFNESQMTSTAGSGHESQVRGTIESVAEHSLEVPQADDNSTGRSVPTTPLQSSPQESIPNVADDQSDRHASHSDDDMPQLMLSPDEETGADGGSEEVMGPPVQAGTSSEENRQDDAEGDDGVSSEGEKQPSTEEGEEEGREAEASPSPIEPRRTLNRGASMSDRRPIRQNLTRGSRVLPTPIVWGDQRSLPQRQMHHERGRGAQGYGGNRRPRRMQRPFGGRF